MPRLECGENFIDGIPQIGTGFGTTKKEAQKLAIEMAQAAMAVVSKAQAALYNCPAGPDCKNKNVEGIVKVNVTVIAAARIAPAFCMSP
jgi:hypothetical protein